MPNSDSIAISRTMGIGQQQHGAADGAFGEILVSSDQRVVDVAPDLAAGALAVWVTYGGLEVSSLVELDRFRQLYGRILKKLRQHALPARSVGGDDGHGLERLARAHAARPAGRAKSWRC